MTKLLIHIPPKYIKQSKKLQEIKCRDFYGYGSWELLSTDNYTFIAEEKRRIKAKWDLRAPTISDIIDNAEMLFGKKYIATKNNGGESQDFLECHLVATMLLDMCQSNKSIDEISEYVIKNIKD